MSSGSRRSAAAIAAALTLSALAGCQTADGGSDPGNPHQVEIVTWWTSGPDGTGLERLTYFFEQQNPGIQVIDASVDGEGGAQARAVIALRLEAGNPPDVLQTSAGAALLGQYEPGQLEDLSGVFDEQALHGVFRDDLLDLLRVDGKLVAVPVDIYRANVLWSDPRKLEAAGVDPDVAPASIEDWISDLERVRGSGIDYPLALGNGLTQVQLFEGVLLARLGGDGYSALWSDRASWTAPAVAEAVDDYFRLLEFADPSDSARDIASTTNQVIHGDAAYVVMADYAERQFQAAGYVFGDRYEAYPVPGTDGLFDVAADGFAIPVGAGHRDAALSWLRTAASVDGQRALSVAKGSLPARRDISSLDYPPYKKTGIADLQVDALVPSLSQGIAAPPAWLDAITRALVESRTGGRSSVLVERLIAAAS